MNFLSVCSGIEAASIAWMPLGWKAVAFSEIEPFPCSVLAHHYPTTPNWGDMTKFKDWPDAAVDLLCGGTPCQAFSVAGLRKGLADPRGNLMLTFGAIAAKYRPRWLVWENVPGVLSSHGGRDFGSFLGILGQLGYGFAYRVLDAQYAGVPQRRRRVFVVGCLGDWRRAAAVLFERHSLSGHPAPRRQTREDVAGTLAGGARKRGGYSHDDVPAVAACLTTGTGQRYDTDTDTILPVAHTLRGEGFDASEDGTGRGTPLVPVLPFDTAQVTSKANRSSPKPGAPCHPLAAGAHAPAIAFPARMSATQHASAENLSPALGATNPTAVAFQSSQSGVRIDDVHATLDANNGPRRHNGMLAGMQVRRLTPRECERLQGFPDDYTAITVRGKPAADGPRYKALGNSWAVPCARWIGERIQKVESIEKRIAV